MNVEMDIVTRGLVDVLHKWRCVNVLSRRIDTYPQGYTYPSSYILTDCSQLRAARPSG